MGAPAMPCAGGVQAPPEPDPGDDSDPGDEEEGGGVRTASPAQTLASNASAASVTLRGLQGAGGPVRKRDVQSLLVFLGLVNVYAMRVNISEAAESMKDRYGWTNGEQGWVLSSFFWGYVVGQVPGGQLSERFGGKHVFGCGVLGTAALTLVLPLCAPRLLLLCSLRALMGLCESVTYPAVNHMYTKWVPCTERSWHIAFTNSGSYLGTAIAFPASGALIGIRKDSSGTSTTWPWVFYGFGWFGILWWCGWVLLGASRPDDCGGISSGELRYIAKTTAEDADTRLAKVAVAKSRRVSWAHLLTHPAAWAVYAIHFADSFAKYMLLTYLPKYLDEVLGYSIKGAGFVAVLPYIGQLAVSLLSGVAADALIRRTSVRTARLLLQAGAFSGSMGFLVAAGWTSDRAACVALLTASVACSGLSHGAYLCNYVDQSPHRAAEFFSVGNTFSNLSGVLAPVVAAAVLGSDSDDSGSGAPGSGDGSGSHPGAARWRDVFYIAAGLYAVAFVVYATFMRGKPVPELN